MDKIAIIGPGGAGKTVLAVQLADKLNVPVHHLDQLFWKENWVKRPVEERERILSHLIASPRWILEGNYSKNFNQIFAAADTLIFLDFPRALLIRRVLRRSFKYFGRTRPDMGGGNIENMFSISYLKLLKWIATYPSDEVMIALNGLPKGNKCIVLRSPAEVKAFLSAI